MDRPIKIFAEKLHVQRHCTCKDNKRSIQVQKFIEFFYEIMEKTLLPTHLAKISCKAERKRKMKLLNFWPYHNSSTIKL